MVDHLAVVADLLLLAQPDHLLVNFHAPVGAHEALDGVPVWMGERLLLGDTAAVDGALHPTVVHGQLVELGLALQIGPAVAQMLDVEIALLDAGNHQCGAHARPVRVVGGHGNDLLVGLAHGLFQTCAQRRAAVVEQIFLDLACGNVAGLGAGRCAGHAVGHQPDGQRLAVSPSRHEETGVAVLIRLVARALVGLGGEVHRLAKEHRLLARCLCMGRCCPVGSVSDSCDFILRHI